MTNILERKTKLVIETPLLLGHRPMIAHVEPWGLRMREKGRRHVVEITWAQMFNRAAIIAADKKLAERKAKRKADGNRS